MTDDDCAAPAIHRDSTGHRFLAEVEGHLAELVYVRHGDRLVLVHTQVPDELSGRGIGGALVRAAVHHAAETGLTIVPRCPFARGWLDRHPDVAAAVRIDRPD